MMTNVYQIGKLSFSISGQDKVIPYLQKELKSIEANSLTPVLNFRFTRVNKELPEGIYVSPVICTPEEIIYSGDGFVYRITADGEVLNIDIESREISGKKRFFPELARVIDWNYLSPTEQMAKNFMYNVFDYLTQIQNLKRGQSYMHASSFTRGSRTIAIVAWGGIGKTTSMLKLVTEDNWQFLSDDLGIIDEEGTIYRSPKKMQIYAYNVEGQPNLKKMLLGGRKMIDMLNWHYRRLRHGIKKVRRRVSAEELFRENVGSKAALTDVFFIERAAIANFSQEPIAINELAAKAASTVMSEIEPFHRIAAAIYSVQSTSVIPTYQDVFDSTQRTLVKAFSKCSPILIKIPLNASPDDLASYLRKLVN